MTDRSYRVLLGIAILLPLYFDWPLVLNGLIAMLLFEGVTNLRIPVLFNRLAGRQGTPGGWRWPIPDEQVWRLMVGLMLLVTTVWFNEWLWFMPWFMGFAILGAGISGVCPMLAALRLGGLPTACPMPVLPPLGSTRVPYRSSLPVHITGIVFWGMMLAGLLIAVVTLQALEKQLNIQRTLAFADTALTVQNALEMDPGLRPGNLARPPARFEELRQHFRFLGLEIKGGGGVWQVGEVSASNPSISQGLHVHGVGGSTDVLQLTAYLAREDSVLQTQRRQIVLLTGLVALLFGLVLQWILQRLLSDPFREMVDAAQHVAAGDKGVRFSEARADEFGFLAGFINQALHTLQQSESALAQEKMRAEVTLRSITDAVLSTDAGGRIQFANPVAETLIGRPNADLQGKRLSEQVIFLNELTREKLPDPVEACLASGESVILQSFNECLINVADYEIPVAGTASPMRDADGQIIGCVIALQDVHQSREMTRQLVHQASRDALTGLYNRSSFETQVQRVLETHDEVDPHHALFFLDLDRFKIVNDTCGHAAGDALLRELASTLHEALRHDDILARLGGDEFGVLLKHCSLEQAKKVADKLRRSVEAYRFTWADKVFQVGVSIGLVAIEPNQYNLTTLLNCADAACYAAKQGGRNQVHVYESSDDALASELGERHWERYLRQALERDRFELHVQPIVALSPDNPHRHWEVLLRLRSEDDEVIGPGVFMASAERYGLTLEIDRWVIRTVFTQFAQKSCNGEVIAINLSEASLLNDGFMSELVAVQAQSGLAWECICFEVPETVAFRHLSRTMSLAAGVRQLGAKFALDDFGSGLSSFANLKNLPIDYLKIDGAFVRDIANDAIDRSMVEAICQVGRIKGIQTVAEWVENPEVANVLRALGVDYAQGFHFGRPDAPDVYSALLTAGQPSV